MAGVAVGDAGPGRGNCLTRRWPRPPSTRWAAGSASCARGARTPTPSSSPPRPTGSRAAVTGWPSASRAAGGWSRSGTRPSARSDVRHVAVEFVHPVIVGKRALPAIGLAAEGGSLRAQVEAVVEADDIAVAFGVDEPDAGETVEALAAARERGAMTIAFAPCGAEWEFEPEADDPFVRQELVETLYHVLWELVHVFFDHRGPARGARGARRPRRRRLELPLSVPGRGGDRPRRGHRATSGESVLMKSAEVGELREQTLGDNAETLAAAAIELRARLDAGARLLACRQWRLGDRRDGPRGRPGAAARGLGMAVAAGDRPHRGLLDPHRDRQRRRGRARSSSAR